MEESQFEIASEIAETDRGNAINAARRSLEPQFSELFDGSSCVECQEKIPEERLQHGRIRCTACESSIEKMARRGR